jgi:hypothetical protein
MQNKVSQNKDVKHAFPVIPGWLSGVQNEKIQKYQ